MSDKERLVKFALLGQEYAFYTGASEEEMNKILHLVRTLVEESAGSAASATIPVSKTAILACLNIASRYIKLQGEFEEFKKESYARAANLAEKIDDSLVAEKRGNSV